MEMENETNTFTLYRNDNLGSTDYHGFTLQEGFYYGLDNEGRYAATSGWCDEQPDMPSTYVYVKNGDTWEGDWYENSSLFLGDEKEVMDKMRLPEKLSIRDWFPASGFSEYSYPDENNNPVWGEYDSYDEFYESESAESIEQCHREYDAYRYDNAPRFVMDIMADAEFERHEEEYSEDLETSDFLPEEDLDEWER